MSKCNNGVRCNVCDCVYNEEGCRCNKDTIDVSMGSSNVEAGVEMANGKVAPHHYCKSFISKSVGK